MNQQDVERFIGQARDLAAETMELHILSVRMGAGSTLPTDHRNGMRIIAMAEGLLADLERMKVAR